MDNNEIKLDDVAGGKLNSEALEKVPNVIGMSFQDASEKLSSKGFRIDFIYAKSDKPKDFVILTDPLCGTNVQKFSKVILTLSNGE